MMNRAYTHLLWTGLLAVLIANGSTAMNAPQAVPAGKSSARNSLRVGFWTLWHHREVQVAPAGAAGFRTCEHCAITPLREPAEVRADDNGNLRLTTGTAAIHADTLILNGAIRITGHGASEVMHFPISFRARNRVLVMAVDLPLESYVEQVVASESGPADTLESLKALAIAVRTFALHEPHGHPDYDVCDSTHCQLLHWQGVAQRRAAAHIAALHTAGETLWFQNRRALAYFNKDCGGQSAAVTDVWPRAAPSPYLASRTDAYCSRTPSQQWAAELTRAELTTALARRGLVAPGWQHLAVERRSESGRVISVRLDRTVISSEDFRIAVGEALGWNRVQSNWFEVSERGDRFYFHGRGSGHGVGLCQKGAAVMGAQGRSATEILAQYFPGAHAADEATGKTWTTLKGDGYMLETLDSSDAAAFLPELNRARGEASQRSGLNFVAPITVRIYASTPGFRDATLAPGWVAAFTEGNWIATQPLRILAQRHLLADTLRHEFLHALVESEAGAGTSLWLREGLVEVWTSEPARQSALGQRHPVLKLDSLDGVLRNARNEAESQTAHHDAAIYAAQLLDRYGRERVLGWLRSGVPAGVLPSLG